MWWWSEERRLERQLARIQRYYRKVIRKAAAKRNREPGELEYLLQEGSETERMAEDELSSVSSQNLLHDARRFGIASPNFKSEAYEEGLNPGTYHLTRAARAELRRLIREEKKARQEEWSGLLKDVVIPIVLALTGLIGVTIGLISASRR